VSRPPRWQHRHPRSAVILARLLHGRHGILAAVAAAACLALTACGSAATGQTAMAGNGQGMVPADPGTTVFGGNAPAEPRVTSKTIEGAPLSLSQFRGHVVVMNFWGSWCTSCRAEAPALAALASRFAPAGVRFLGVDVLDNTASAQAFDRNFHITYPSLNDPGDLIALAFRSTVPPAGIPTTLVISGNGRISARVIGEVSYSGLRELISKAMAGTT
jgi:thiol-disulfide isomerase/thioredoxin